MIPITKSCSNGSAITAYFSILKLIHFFRIFLASRFTQRRCSMTSLSILGMSSWFQVNTSLCSIRSWFSCCLTLDPILVPILVIALRWFGFRVMSYRGSSALTHLRLCLSHVSSPCSMSSRSGGGDALSNLELFATRMSLPLLLSSYT